MAVTARDICQDALFELRALAPDTDSTDERLTQFVLSRLNQLVDQWNATRELVYCQIIQDFTFTPAKQDYTIGPSTNIPAPDFAVAGNRPVSIEKANLVINNVSPTVTQNIHIRSYQWWMGLTVQAITTNYPTDLYYEPNWPLGILHFWPVPTLNYGLQMTYRVVLPSFGVNTAFSMPPGYQKALTLTLAEDIAPALGATALSSFPQTVKKAAEARNQIGVNNDYVPNLVTQDSGMPSSTGYRNTFNYRTGMLMPPARN